MKRIFSILLSSVLLFNFPCAGLFEKSPVYSSNSKTALGILKTPLKNQAVVAYVNQIANNLVKNESPEKIGVSKINVNVLQTPRIQGNSYFHTGEINITRGMLNTLTNEAELAALKKEIESIRLAGC